MNELIIASVPVIGRALVHFVWQGGVIGLLASIALFSLRHARPQTRYAVACAALLTCLLAPLLDVALQLASWRGSAAPVFETGGDGFLIATATAAAVSAPDAWVAPLEGWLPTLVAMWAAGATVFCLRMALGVAWIERLRSTAQPGSHAAWQARLDGLSTRLGIRAPVALRIVDALPSPAAVGWLRPAVLLPASLIARMPVDYLEALLAHELAHIRRHDYLVNLLQGVVEALLFFHPVVWWLSRQVRVERELIADALAVEAIGNPHRLARALAALSDLQTSPGATPHLAQAAHGGSLVSRIEHLLRPNRRIAGRVAFPVLGIAAACIAFIAHAQMTGDVRKPVAQTSPASLQPEPARATPLPGPTANATKGVLGLAPPSVPRDATADVDWDPEVEVAVDMDLDPMFNAAALAESAAVASASAIAQAVAPLRAAGHASTNGWGRRNYALVRSGREGTVVTGHGTDSERFDAMRAKVGRDFVWFSHEGRDYAVTDPALVSRAQSAWRESEAIGKQMSGLGREMEAHGQRMSEIGQRMGRVQVNVQPSPEMQRAQQRLSSLAARQGQLAAEQARHAVNQTRQAARMAANAHLDEDRLELEIEQQVERQMAAMEARMEALEPEIERQAAIIEAEAERMARASVPMEAFEREMEAAAKPMEALGERMGELGERQGRASREADREMRDVIRDALDRGLARPVERAATP
ncbi:M56 family metallopeptidase [Cognatilysobacter bugurensis]|uniref:Peptidase M56 domain-containing protein n=1 Tax=Cognatilysobacter bugurensis TaxID=543356 RepID=A0A918W7G5_9GAMM|nr:M56 family metallopeptidase [Lysobacter bugurensis]GHA72700.1 hypothetical protein GCM10007067_06550 [Lysobacter bugurensis]